MTQQGPLIVISHGERRASVISQSCQSIFPVVDVDWSKASKAIERLQPTAVVVHTTKGAGAKLNRVADQLAAMQPYVPLIVADSEVAYPDNALPFSFLNGGVDRLDRRLNAALRVRTLHATVLRRLASNPATTTPLPDDDPIRDATVLLIGRGATYPALSVAFGERLSVVGALSIEAAAKHLNARDLDGIVISEGFTQRVIDALMTVLAEDSRFRNLPVAVMTSDPLTTYDLPNLEVMSGEPCHVVGKFLPLVRQQAFEVRLRRTLRSMDAGGLLDSRTGLLTPDAFHRELNLVIHQARSSGASISVARFSFGEKHERLLFDAARILSRLMRRMDFGTLENDGSIVVVFADADLRNTRMIARRLSNVMKHTRYGAKRALRIDPQVALTASRSNDSAKTLLARLNDEACRAAS